MKRTVRIAALAMALVLALSCLAGCQQNQAKTYKILEENFGAETTPSVSAARMLRWAWRFRESWMR